MKFIRRNILLVIILTVISCNNKQSQSKITSSGNGINEVKAEADLAYEKDEHTKSIVLFDKLISFDSTQGEYYFKRGYSYMMILSIKKSEMDFVKSAELSYRITDSYFNAGLNYATINDSIAIYYFKKCLKNDPNDESAKRKLAECESRLNNKNK